jgi:V/A-type H+/Na+-transporting ATPase subunit K
VDDVKKKFKLRITGSLVVLITVLAIILTVFCVGVYAQPPSSGEAEQATTALAGEHKATIATYALISAAIAFGLGALGAGYAISHVGAAAMGAIAEKPQMASQALIFVALAEGIVIFGFIMGLMILGKM